MNWSGLSKRFAALALSSMIVASSTTSVLALQLPPDDDEDEDEIEYSRSEALEAAIEAQQNGTYGIHDDTTASNSFLIFASSTSARSFARKPAS